MVLRLSNRRTRSKDASFATDKLVLVFFSATSWRYLIKSAPGSSELLVGRTAQLPSFWDFLVPESPGCSQGNALPPQLCVILILGKNSKAGWVGQDSGGYL